MDYLGCKNDKQVGELLDAGETIIMSCLADKYNHVNKCQERILLITDRAIYNLSKPNLLKNLFSYIAPSSRIKRRIGLENMFGMTVNRYGSEFIIHVTNEHDYRYSSADKYSLRYVGSRRL